MSKPQKRWSEITVTYIHFDDPERTARERKNVLEMVQLEEEQLHVRRADNVSPAELSTSDSLLFGGISAYPENTREYIGSWKNLSQKKIPIWAYESGTAVLLPEPPMLKRLAVPEIMRIHLTEEGKKDTVFGILDDLFYSACYFQPLTLFNHSAGIPLAETAEGQVVAFRNHDGHAYGTLFHPFRYKGIIYRFFKKFVAQPELLA